VSIEYGPVRGVTSIHSLYEISTGQFDEVSILAPPANSDLVNDTLMVTMPLQATMDFVISSSLMLME